MKLLGTTTTAAVAVLLTAPAAAAAPAEVFRGDLVDLSSTVADPFANASAHLVMAQTANGTLFHLRVKGIDLVVAGTAYGAHLHIGPCVEGNGAAALGHYNASMALPPVVNAQTEVWLDFEVTDDGTGAGDALVPFLPVAGEHSVVIHAEATAPSGAAGPRLVCLPVAW